MLQLITYLVDYLEVREAVHQKEQTPDWHTLHVVLYLDCLEF